MSTSAQQLEVAPGLPSVGPTTTAVGVRATALRLAVECGEERGTIGTIEANMIRRAKAFEAYLLGRRR